MEKEDDFSSYSYYCVGLMCEYEIFHEYVYK